MAKGRVIKWSLGILAALLIICFGAVAYIISAIDFNQFKPEIEKAALDSTGRKLTLAGDVELKISLSPALTVENVSFANAKWGSRPNLASIKRLEVQVAVLPLLTGSVQLKRLILIDPDILVETNKDGVSNLAFDTGKEKAQPAQKEAPSQPQTSGAMPQIEIDELVLKNARLTYKDGQTGKSEEVVLETVQAGLQDDNLKFSVKGTYNSQPFQLDGNTGELAKAFDPKAQWPIQVKAQAGGATVSLDGAIKDLTAGTGIDVKFNVDGKNLTDLNTLTGAKLPDLGKYAFSGKISDTGPKAYQIADIQGQLGESDFSGKAALDMNGKRPALNLSLASRTLDLRPFLPDKSQEIEKGKPSTEKTAETKKKSDRVLPDDPLPTDLFFLADCKADIKVGTVQLEGYSLTDILVDLALKNGVLDVPALKATGGEGTLNMALKAIAKGKDLSLDGKATLDQLNIGGVLGFMGVTEAFMGNLDMDLDFKGKGASVRQIMAGLDGFLNMSVKDGKLQNKYLDLLGGDLASGFLRMINPASESKDYTKVNCLINRFNVENGLASAKVMIMDTEYMSVVGDGTIDFNTEKLNMSLDPMPKKGVLSGLNINLSFSMSELAQPFALGGTLAAPKLVLDRTKAVLTLGKGVGGALLFGPAGAAAALLGGTQAEGNPCEAAAAAAEKGVKYEGEESEKGVAEKATDTVVDGLKGVGKGLKDLFGQ